MSAERRPDQLDVQIEMLRRFIDRTFDEACRRVAKWDLERVEYDPMESRRQVRDMGYRVRR